MVPADQNFEAVTGSPTDFRFYAKSGAYTGKGESMYWSPVDSPACDASDTLKAFRGGTLNALGTVTQVPMLGMPPGPYVLCFSDGPGKEFLRYEKTRLSLGAVSPEPNQVLSGVTGETLKASLRTNQGSFSGAEVVGWSKPESYDCYNMVNNLQFSVASGNPAAVEPKVLSGFPEGTYLLCYNGDGKRFNQIRSVELKVGGVKPDRQRFTSTSGTGSVSFQLTAASGAFSGKERLFWAPKSTGACPKSNQNSLRFTIGSEGSTSPLDLTGTKPGLYSLCLDSVGQGDYTFIEDVQLLIAGVYPAPAAFARLTGESSVFTLEPRTEGGGVSGVETFTWVLFEDDCHSRVVGAQPNPDDGGRIESAANGRWTTSTVHVNHGTPNSHKRSQTRALL